VIDFYKPEPPEEAKSELWIADTDTDTAKNRKGGDGGTKFLTYGFGGAWHPDTLDGNGRVFYFAGKGKVWVCGVGSEDGEGKAEEPQQVPGLAGVAVQSFAISPDGAWIAFSAVKQKAQDQKQRTQSDAKVYSFNPSPDSDAATNSIHLIPCPHFPISSSSSQPEPKPVELTPSLPPGFTCIESFSWATDGLSILYRVRKGKEVECAYQEGVLQRVFLPSFPSSDTSSTPISTPTETTVKRYPRSPSGETLLLNNDLLVDLQNYDLGRALDARTLYLTMLSDEDNPGTRRFYGEKEDAIRIVNALPSSSAFPTSDSTSSASQSIIAVEVATQTETHIDAIFLQPNAINSTPIRIFETKPQEEAIWFNSWDARALPHGDDEFEFVVGVILSSLIRHEPPNLWIVRSRWRLLRNGGAEQTKAMERRKVSEHLKWLVEAPKIEGEVIRWSPEEGTELDGLVRYPPGYSKESSSRMPTVLFIHGGPYRRDIPDYMPYFAQWRELLSSSGYVVISPNYRGSQGRGHSSQATYLEEAWQDCLSMLEEVVKRGIADPERLGVAGWSHGGSLVAWGITRPRSSSPGLYPKAAIIGGGVTSWDAMVFSTGVAAGWGTGGSPELEMAISGVDPWTPNRNQNPMNLVEHVPLQTAILILHGEKDERVPVGQAVGFYRGVVRARAEARDGEGGQGEGSVELVVYPREGHGFVERKHVKDVCERVLEHFGRWL
ncbi:hypothetical protein V5O48_016835, partial [Marasmius crinis-equi]